MEKELKKYLEENNIEVEVEEKNKYVDEYVDEYGNYTTNIVTLIGYLCGVRKDILESENKDDFEKYNNIDECKIIRSLSILRMNFMLSTGRINQAIRDLVPIETLECVDGDAIKYLRRHDIEIIKINCSAQILLTYINQYFINHIDKIKKYIPDWVKWQYVRNLFLIPGGASGNNGELIKNKSSLTKTVDATFKVRETFLKKRQFYPYGVFMNWPFEKMKPYYGNILFNDSKFLKILYSAYDDTFKGSEYVTTATATTMQSVYDFIDDSINVSVFVDCENVDPYRFASVFISLEDEKISKIKKIVLFDDENTSTAWDYISNIINIPVEHHLVKRVLENKSLVDVAMTAGVCKAYYQENTESMILASSDSDFWGVISALPYARFFVLNESDKTSQTILEAFDRENINYCFMDEFSLDAAQGFKYRVLNQNLEEIIEEFNESGFFRFNSPNELVTYIFDIAGVNVPYNQKEKEKEAYIEKYLKGGFIIKPVKNEAGDTIYIMEINHR